MCEVDHLGCSASVSVPRMDGRVCWRAFGDATNTRLWRPEFSLTIKAILLCRSTDLVSGFIIQRCNAASCVFQGACKGRVVGIVRLMRRRATSRDHPPTSGNHLNQRTIADVGCTYTCDMLSSGAGFIHAVCEVCERPGVSCSGACARCDTPTRRRGWQQQSVLD